ncbi:MAG: tetratricopeptide repeat protein [Deltaproteobacteria bacterium]|nr:tetratricopeptide repeat protein [Deltaproteobacteria bacterium]
MKEKLIHLLLIACLVTLFYANSFANFFVWNDWTLIIENFLVKDRSNLPEIFTSAFWKPLVGEPSQIYRPLVSLSFMVDFSLWGLKPWGYHLTNTALHVLNSVLAYFLMRLYVSPVIALMTTLLFAVHPIHTEAVTYISGRSDLLMSLFVLGGALLFLRSERRKSWWLYLASLPLFFLSLFAKETAVVLPLWLVIADLTAFRSSLRGHTSRLLLRQIGPVVTLALYFIVRRYFAGMTLSNQGPASPDLVRHLLIVLNAIPVYVGLLLFPWKVHFIHPPAPQDGFLDLHLLLSILLLVGAGWGLRAAARSDNSAALFALSWSLAGLLPLIHFTGLNLPLLEGWVYLPSLGFFLLAALFLGRLQFRGPSRLHIWLTVLMAVLLGGITLNRNQDWKDDLQISLHTAAVSPEEPIALRLLGDAYFRRGRTDKAEQLFQKAVLLAPRDPRSHESLGQLYDFNGKNSEALTRYHLTRELAPKDPYAYWRLGRYYLRQGNSVEAELYFREAQRLFPRSSELRNSLAQVYYLQGKFGPAEAELRAALRILPYSRALRNNLEQILKRKR